MTGHPEAVTRRPFNGHVVTSSVPFVLPPAGNGPSSPWPPPSGEEAAAAEAPPEGSAGRRAVTPSRERPRWPSWRLPEGAVVIRLASSLAVLAVSAIAAVISYSHIYALALSTHEFGTDARLLPLSVDGLILASSLTLLDAARRDLTAPVMAYLMLAVGVGATIAANVQYGLPYGWKASCVAAWPAVAFIGSVEVALRMTRSHRRRPGSRARRWLPWGRDAALDDAVSGDPVTTPSPEAPEPPVTPSPGPPPAPAARPSPRPVTPSRKPPARPAKAPKGTSSSDGKITAAIASGAVTAADSYPVIARAAGVSESSVERWRRRQRDGAAG